MPMPIEREVKDYTSKIILNQGGCNAHFEKHKGKLFVQLPGLF